MSRFSSIIRTAKIKIGIWKIKLRTQRNYCKTKIEKWRSRRPFNFERAIMRNFASSAQRFPAEIAKQFKIRTCRPIRNGKHGAVSKTGADRKAIAGTHEPSTSVRRTRQWSPFARYPKTIDTCQVRSNLENKLRVFGLIIINERKIHSW